MLKAYKMPIFAKGQKLTHSPAHEEKHEGQETPLHYTHYRQHQSSKAGLALITCTQHLPGLLTLTPTHSTGS